MVLKDLKKFIADNPDLSDYTDICIIGGTTDFEVGGAQSIYLKRVGFSEDSGAKPIAYETVIILDEDYKTPEEIEEFKNKL